MMQFSLDQAQAHDAISAILRASGLHIEEQYAENRADKTQRIFAVMGKAGSGKTLLLAKLAQAVEDCGVSIISGDYDEGAQDRSLAILAPTNKAASVLRGRGIKATTLHRILYRPNYDPLYEAIAEWLLGKAERPENEDISQDALDRAKSFYATHQSIPAALASVGLRGSDFITGWTRRDDALDIGFVDEASMLDDRQMEDLQEIFSTLILFGDPAQLAPVGQAGSMSFDKISEQKKCKLTHIHRQVADNPILSLAHALSDPEIRYADFEMMIKRAALKDDRVKYVAHVSCDLMARSPVLVWRNATRIRLISAFRRANDFSVDALFPGEPLICDGIELNAKNRKKRVDLEAQGLIKGAQVIYLGRGRKHGFSRLHVLNAPEPQVSAATIIKIEMPNEEQPFIPHAARQGAVFVHGAACTIHKAQGSQWAEVQIFAPDIEAAFRTNREEAGIPMWKRLAYVAMTRAQERLYWVTHARLKKPKSPLGVDDFASKERPDLVLVPDKAHETEGE